MNNDDRTRRLQQAGHLERIELAYELLAARGWEQPEWSPIVFERTRRRLGAATKADVLLNGFPWVAYEAAARELLQEARLTMHTARECCCGRGMTFEDESGTGGSIALVFTAGPFVVLPSSEFTFDRLRLSTFNLDERIRCDHCGRSARFTHFAVLRDGEPSFALDGRDAIPELSQ